MSFYLQKLSAVHLTPVEDKENEAAALATVQTFAVAFSTRSCGLHCQLSLLALLQFRGLWHSRHIQHMQNHQLACMCRAERG